jgi:hypothetical protein
VTKKAQEQTHEYDGETVVYLMPAVPVFVRVYAQRKAASWTYGGTELGRRTMELGADQADGETIPADAMDNLSNEASTEDKTALAMLHLVGVVELVDHIQSCSATDKRGEALKTWLLKNRLPMLEELAQKVFAEDDTGARVQGLPELPATRRVGHARGEGRFLYQQLPIRGRTHRAIGAVLGS